VLDVSSIEIRGGPAIARTLNALGGRELQNRTARGTRAGAGVFRKELRADVKSGFHPATFRKVATRNHRNPIGTSVGPTSPLINIFEGGAGSHVIAPGKLQSSGNRPMLLSGKGGEHYRPRDFAASMPVTHPGMGARPLIGPVFDRSKDRAADAAIDKILEGLPR
jgi:hypothetical protein